MIPDSEGKNHPIGAPTYSLLLTLNDTEGKYIKDKNKTTMDDVWNLAKVIIPANAERISQLCEEQRGKTQVPVYMNTIPDVCVRPAAQ